MKKALKITFLVITFLAFVGVMYHYVRGIYCSLFANDIKTAQNRIDSAYQFMMMIASGVVMIGGFVASNLVKCDLTMKGLLNKILKKEEMIEENVA